MALEGLFSAPISRAGLTAFRRQSSYTLMTRKSTRQRNRSYFRIVARSVGQLGQLGRRSGSGVMSKGGGGGGGGGGACGALGRPLFALNSHQTEAA